jgi:signal transduction histidine kinase
VTAAPHSPGRSFSLRAVSLRAKLIGMVMATTLVALSLAGGALALFEFRSHRRTLADELTTVASMVGQILPAALVLRRVDTATQALHTLESHRDVVSACLYFGTGELFASYGRAGQPPACPPALAGNGAATTTEFAGDTLVLTQPIAGEDADATLRIVASMGEVQRRMRLFFLVLLLVLSGAALAALVLSSGLQRLVSTPILELASTAQQIARNYDYTLRAPQRTHDEVGAAVDAFNQMLDRIEGAVSERIKAEEALMALNTTLEERVADRTAAAEQKAAELKRSNEELERFASVASHDLQEPLRAVSSYTQLLKERLAPSMDEEMAAYLNHVIGGVGRMKVLINDLLNYSRVGRTLSRTLVDVNTVLDAALADLNTAITESGAVITRDPLPKVWANPGQLGQVLNNLVLNAIRFRGEAAPRIHISAQGQGEFWRLAVADNGIGIDAKHHDRIFIIFQRLHGRDRPGTGIGLAICRKIVELHGGKIWVESEPDKGSTFYFTMPAHGE